MNELIKARLVYDGGDRVAIPPEMGLPRADQMQGTAAEQLSELAGRVCYDSLGKGRPSFSTFINSAPGTENAHSESIQGYHDHILQVGHGSVLEHFNFTVEIPIGVSRKLNNDFCSSDARQALYAWQCSNRPGVLTLGALAPQSIRVTVNLRSVLEWLNWGQQLYGSVTPMDVQIARMLHRLAHELAPHIVEEHPQLRGVARGRFGSASLLEYDEFEMANLVAPISDNERWISMFVTGSRGLSHELVRHGDFTAISQRSTRFVDESESPWVEHPLSRAFWEQEVYAGKVQSPPHPNVIGQCQAFYQSCVNHLEPWLIARGVEKTTARKQARGAARGYLGNALYTELIFSANVAQWKRMLRQRASQFADAEIRELFCKVLAELRQSRYADRFEGFTLADSPDGIGQVAIETAA